MITNLILKTFSSLKSKNILLILAKTILITAFLLAAFVVLVNIAVDSFELVSIGWTEWILDYLLNTGAMVFAWFLFPILLPFAAIFVKDHIITSLERNEYPDLVGNKNQPLTQEMA